MESHARADSPVPSTENPGSRATLARPEPSPEQRAAAEGYFRHGQVLFSQGKYGVAWVEFSSAYQLVDLPDLVFNMALAEEKLNRPADAARHFREFLARSPNDPQAAMIQAKIDQLEHPQSASSQPPSSSSTSSAGDKPRRFPVYSTIAAGGTILFTVIGAAALGAARGKYDGLAGSCAPSCAVADVQGLQPVIQTGQAFLSLAAFGAAGTIGLLVWELRFKRGERGTAVSFGPSRLHTYGSY